jgi:hypothetical protein
MSMPRAAMSVATSTWILPCLKSSSARVRAPCDLLPWIAAQRQAVARQALGQAVGAVLGAGEHQALAHVTVIDQARQQRMLARCRRDRRDDRSARPACCAARRRYSPDRAGCRAPVRGSRSEKVAENSRFCRCFGSAAMMLADRADEAHVEHAIGFVQHQHFDARQIYQRAPWRCAPSPRRRA